MPNQLDGYLLPVILGVILIVGIAVLPGLIGRLGRRDTEDPAIRAVARRHGRRRD